VPNKTGSSTPEITILPITTLSSVPTPSLKRALPDTSKLDPLFVSSAEAKIKNVIKNIENNKKSFNDWIDLGLLRKSLGDYEGARQAWEYISILYPTNEVSFGNLGDLYANFLHDYAKAESAYQLGIKNNSKSVDFYRNLFNLYILENKNTQAVTLLQNGIAKNPSSYDFQILLARYYRDAGNIVTAKVYYDQAIAIVEQQGNASIANSLKAEETAMK
jgi:tetratricopeptide (TPR) repeat protein